MKYFKQKLSNIFYSAYNQHYKNNKSHAYFSKCMAFVV